MTARALTKVRHALAPVGAARGTSRWLLWAGIGLTALFVAFAVLAPVLAPYGFNDVSAGGVRFPQQAPPSAEHWFGTTVQSKDVLARVIWGSRSALEVVVLAVAISVLVGVPLGLVSGYLGGRLDRALVLVNDALFAFPSLLLALVIAFVLEGVLGGGVMTAAIAITVVYIPQYFRVVRNSVLAVREEPYVEAARAIGAASPTVIRKYVLGNVVQSVPVIASLNAADAILTLASLSFIGIGVDPSASAQWGYDVARAIADAQAGYWWTGVFPGLAIILLVTGLTLAGEGLNDVLNPVLRRPGWDPVAPPPAEAETAQAEVLPQQPDPATALSVRDLRVLYGSDRGTVHAVDGVSFDVRRGEIFGLVGESGCGKSSLSRGLMGLLPPGARRDGQILLDGRPLLGVDEQELRRIRGASLGLVFQEPMSRLDPLMRISEHFAETLRAHEPGISDAEVQRRSLAALGGMGIPPTRFSNYPHEFSGGMRQRIMIALALVLNPAVIVADEPTTALDVLVEAQILEILADLKRNFDTAMVLITHDLGVVAEVCDSVGVMYAGKLVEHGPVADVYANPQHPYTAELLRSAISLETTELHFIPGAPPDLASPPSGCRFHPRCPRAMDVCAAKVPRDVARGPGWGVACWLHDAESEPPVAYAGRPAREEVRDAGEA